MPNPISTKEVENTKREIAVAETAMKTDTTLETKRATCNGKNSLTDNDPGLGASKNPSFSQLPQFSWMKNGKSLSKNLLYTPLEAYQEAARNHDPNALSAAATGYETSFDPSQYLSGTKKVPKSVQEPSFVNFMHTISQDFHRNRATISDAKNNGSRPLSLNDMEDRIRSRAVTLVGGGINASVSSKSKRTSLSSQKRRQHSFEQAEPALKSGGGSTNAVDFLTAMNTSWNEYILSNILLSTPCATLESMKQRLVSLLPFTTNADGDCHRLSSRVELVGAHVRIHQCPSRNEWVGRSFILVGETLNTWRLAGLATKRQKQRRMKQKKEGDEKAEMKDMDNTEKHSTSVDPPPVKVFLVPKKGTTLVVIVPLPGKVAGGDAGDANLDGSNTNNGANECIIPVVDSSITVELST